MGTLRRSAVGGAVLYWLCVLTALAADPASDPPEEEPEEEPEAPPPLLVMPTEGRIVLPEPAPMASALDDPSPIEGEDGASLSWLRAPRDVWGGRNIVRPRMGMRVHDSGAPLLLGMAVGRQWWQLREGPRLLAEAVLGGEAALASGLGSWSTDLTVLGGGGVGPVALQVGPSLVAERTVLGPLDLGQVVALAPVAQLTLDLKYVQLVGAVAPRFFLSGDREAAPGTLPGDEPEARVGAGLRLGMVRVSADWTGRWTVADRIDRFGIGMRLRL